MFTHIYHCKVACSAKDNFLQDTTGNSELIAAVYTKMPPGHSFLKEKYSSSES